MIRKTEKLFTRRINHIGNKPSAISSNWERVRATTWWLFFIPIYRSEHIEASTM